MVDSYRYGAYLSMIDLTFSVHELNAMMTSLNIRSSCYDAGYLSLVVSLMISISRHVTG